MPPDTISICVFCGSRRGRDPAHTAAAAAVGRMLAARKWRLVYGAGDVGMMGEVARAVQAAGGRTFGVIPVHLMKLEAGKRDLSQFVVTENMHERKKVMFMNADAIVTLPGGPGSMDEFFEVMTWRQLGLHEKPIYLLNVGGYWDPLVALIEHMVEAGFADQSFRDFVKILPTVEALEAQIARDLG